MAKKRTIVLSLIGGILVLAWVWVGVHYAFSQWDQQPPEGRNSWTSNQPWAWSEQSEKQEEERISTITPKRMDTWQSLTLIWNVRSNEFATIYARRNWIIKDLYVDIGDTIRENQQIGELLPPGDVWQSSANIFEKQVKVDEAVANLEYIKNLSEQVINKNLLAEEFQWLTWTTASAETLNAIQVDIDSNEQELSQMRSRHVEQRKKIEDDIAQQEQQVVVLVESTIQALEHIMLWDNHNVNTITIDSLRNNLGMRNTDLKRRALNAYRTLSKTLYKSEYETYDELLTITYSTLTRFLELIEYSTTRNEGEMLTQDMLEEFTQTLLTRQTNILKVQEMLVRLENTYNNTLVQQEEEIVRKENTIRKLIAKRDESWANLQERLEKTQQDGDLIRAEQELKIQQAENKVAIAKAQLSKEYSTSGNKSIITPFWGTVSKRMVDVGDVVSMGMPLYELIDVPTSLGKNTKREVQFWLPEKYLWALSLWDRITFSTAQSDAEVFTGTIHRISPQVDQVSKTITVQASLPDTVQFPHNSRVNVRLNIGEESIYQVPSATIVYSWGNTYIPVLQDDNTTELITISVLAEDWEFTDIQWAITQETQVIKNYTTMQ